MYQILFLVLALAVLCTAFRLLWIAFPRLKSKSGKILTACCFGGLLLPLLLPILLPAPPAYTFSVICIAGFAAAALIDGREGTTAFELYPVGIGLTAPIIMVTDFLSETPVLYRETSSPVIGLLIGLGAAALAGMVEMAISPSKPLIPGTIEIAAIAGFSAGVPGVAWVLGSGALLCLGVWLYRRKYPKQKNIVCCSGCIAYALVLYLCLHPLLGI
ncbi:MAG: hypothetical protein HFJ85_07190 [Oscillospiraceae bacterium]|nr:hypothetical protein [Oscillospiraceae bacterium]